MSRVFSTGLSLPMNHFPTAAFSKACVWSFRGSLQDLLVPLVTRIQRLRSENKSIPELYSACKITNTSSCAGFLNNCLRFQAIIKSQRIKMACCFRRSRSIAFHRITLTLSSEKAPQVRTGPTSEVQIYKLVHRHLLFLGQTDKAQICPI